MNLEVEVWYSLEDNLQEPCTVQITEEMMSHIFMRYIRENKGTEARLEDWAVSSVCLD